MACSRRLAHRPHRPTKVRLPLGEKRRVADAEILGVEAGEALVVLLGGERPRVGEPAREFLVPARDQRRASAMRCAVASASAATWSSATTRVTRRFSFASCASKIRPSSRISSATSAPASRDQRRHFRIRHHEAQILDRRAEAARRAADPQVAQRGDLETAADADAVDLRDQRMAAGGQRVRRRVHHLAVVDRLRLVRALGRELARCRCRAKTPSRRRRAR